MLTSCNVYKVIVVSFPNFLIVRPPHDSYLSSNGTVSVSASESLTIHNQHPIVGPGLVLLRPHHKSRPALSGDVVCDQRTGHRCQYSRSNISVSQLCTATELGKRVNIACPPASRLPQRPVASPAIARLAVTPEGPGLRCGAAGCPAGHWARLGRAAAAS